MRAHFRKQYPSESTRRTDRIKQSYFTRIQETFGLIIDRRVKYGLNSAVVSAPNPMWIRSESASRKLHTDEYGSLSKSRDLKMKTQESMSLP